MGIYKLTDDSHNNHPKWKMNNGKVYIYRDTNGEWRISENMHGADIRSISDILPTPYAIYARWGYWSLTDLEWKKDNSCSIKQSSEGI